MKVLIINQQEIKQLLTMRACMQVVRDAFSALGQGQGVQPLRPVMRMPEGLMGLMPAFLAPLNASAVKVITIYPSNHGTNFDSHQGAVLLFDNEHGSLKAILDASEITAIRTAAASGVATELLAKTDAAVCTIMGSGVQARTHIEAMLEARPSIKEVRVWSRNEENGQKLVAQAQSRHDNSAFFTIRTAQEAVSGADIICTTTSSTEPVLLGEWLSAGVHINAVGSSVPTARELDTEAVVKSRLFVDRLESAHNEAGDFLIPKLEGAITDAHILGEVGDLLNGSKRGRTNDQEITLFKSLGIGVQDLASAHYIYERAVAENAGTWLELGGER
jgi:ornithine cyclodeaminase